ncbi:thiol:disulfide interchange protein DsbA/DsbL [Paucibacter sp. AS339]|uniref:thiol:disulfide interchange protein DsbA/DsbL n=1 Tax=Paucibacter hankyongi TaxID=3133434 RepID=UPI0030ACDD73
MIKRRDFSATLGLGTLAGLGLAGAMPGLAQAQGGPIEGKQFERLAAALPPTHPGKIEVIEFFWYGCPHCFAFDPALSAWVKQLPADVTFRRVHVSWNAYNKLHQRLFFALEAMGKEAEVHDQVFHAFQVDRLPLDSEKSITELAVKLGLDGAKFSAAFNNFGMNAKCEQANKLSEAFHIDGVPALGIGGMFLTSPSKAGIRGQSEQQLGKQALAVADYLINLARQRKG